MACGVAAIVTWRRRVLFGKRAARSGGYEWQLPGGWIEPGEPPAQAAAREVLEETGLAIEDPRFVAVTSNVFSPREHSITLYFEAPCIDAAALESGVGQDDPKWQWRDWSQVDGRLFLPLELLKNSEYRPFSRDRRRTCVSI